jgi:hypothetical protein
MRGLLTVVFSVVIVAMAVYAWLNRYEYRIIEVAPEVFLETKLDTWTGATCVAHATAWEKRPRDVPGCDNVSFLVPSGN